LQTVSRDRIERVSADPVFRNSVDDLVRADVFDYIERFHNPRRRHSTLGQVSLDQFERANEGLR
jgi:transposase InsO family protein